MDKRLTEIFIKRSDSTSSSGEKKYYSASRDFVSELKRLAYSKNNIALYFYRV